MAQPPPHFFTDTEDDFLSTVYPRVISVGEEGYFKSAEHAYQVIRLRSLPGIRPREIFNIEDEDNARILKGLVRKKILEQTPIRDISLEDKERLMYQILKAKFDQYSDLRKSLIDTAPSLLAFASTDRVWGIGYTTQTPALMEKTWAPNRLGRLLMVLRDQLAGRRDFIQMSLPTIEAAEAPYRNKLVPPRPKPPAQSESTAPSTLTSLGSTKTLKRVTTQGPAPSGTSKGIVTRPAPGQRRVTTQAPLTSRPVRPALSLKEISDTFCQVRTPASATVTSEQQPSVQKFLPDEPEDWNSEDTGSSFILGHDRSLPNPNQPRTERVSRPLDEEYQLSGSEDESEPTDWSRMSHLTFTKPTLSAAVAKHKRQLPRRGRRRLDGHFDHFFKDVSSNLRATLSESDTDDPMETLLQPGPPINHKQVAPLSHVDNGGTNNTGCGGSSPSVAQEVVTAADDDIPVLEISVDHDLEEDFGVGEDIRKPVSPQQSSKVTEVNVTDDFIDLVEETSETVQLQVIDTWESTQAKQDVIPEILTPHDQISVNSPPVVVPSTDQLEVPMEMPVLESSMAVSESIDATASAWEFPIMPILESTGSTVTKPQVHKNWKVSNLRNRQYYKCKGRSKYLVSECPVCGIPCDRLRRHAFQHLPIFCEPKNICWECKIPERLTYSELKEHFRTIHPEGQFDAKRHAGKLAMLQLGVLHFLKECFRLETLDELVDLFHNLQINVRVLYRNNLTESPEEKRTRATICSMYGLTNEDVELSPVGHALAILQYRNLLQLAAQLNDQQISQFLSLFDLRDFWGRVVDPNSL